MLAVPFNQVSKHTRADTTGVAHSGFGVIDPNSLSAKTDILFRKMHDAKLSSPICGPIGPQYVDLWAVYAGAPPPLNESNRRDMPFLVVPAGDILKNPEHQVALRVVNTRANVTKRSMNISVMKRREVEEMVKKFGDKRVQSPYPTVIMHDAVIPLDVKQMRIAISGKLQHVDLLLVVQLNSKFPRMVAHKVDAAFLSIVRLFDQLPFKVKTPEPEKLGVKEMISRRRFTAWGMPQLQDATDMWRDKQGFERERIRPPLPPSMENIETKRRYEYLREKISASIFFYSASCLLRAPNNANLGTIYQAIAEMKPLGLGQQFDSQFESIYTSKLETYQHDDTKIRVSDLHVTLLRWLYVACCHDPDVPELDSSKVNSMRFNRVVFSSDWCFFFHIRKIIRNEFKKYQIHQRLQRKYDKYVAKMNAANRPVMDRDTYDTMKKSYDQDDFYNGRISTPSSQMDDVPVPPLKNSRVVFDFEVLDFDPHDPFSILDNVPQESMIYDQFMILCQIFTISFAAASPRFKNWTDAVLDKYPQYDFERLERLLQIDLLPRCINAGWLTSRAAVAMSNFEMKVRYLMADISRMLQNDSFGYDIPPMILEHHYEPLLR